MAQSEIKMTRGVAIYADGEGGFLAEIDGMLIRRASLEALERLIKFREGDKVQATGWGRELIDGIVKERSTDREIWGAGSGRMYYLVQSDAWPEPKWIVWDNVFPLKS